MSRNKKSGIGGKRKRDAVSVCVSVPCDTSLASSSHFTALHYLHLFALALHFFACPLPPLTLSPRKCIKCRLMTGIRCTAGDADDDDVWMSVGRDWYKKERKKATYSQAQFVSGHYDGDH